MRRRQNPFAETGGASSFKTRIEDQSNGITDLPGVDHLGDLTPFQNQVLDYAAKKEAEEKEKKREEMREEYGDGSSRQRNPRSNSGKSDSDLGREETIRYVNKEENPDHEVHESE